MNKTSTLIILILAHHVTQAQFSQAGQKLISGSVFFNSSKSTNSVSPGIFPTGYSTGLFLNVGKFTKTNVLTTLGINYTHGTSKQVTPINTSINPINGVGLSFGKTYYKHLAKQLFIGIGGSVGGGYNSTIIKNDQANNGSKSEGYFVGLNVAPILNYQITKRFVISVGPANNFLGVAYGYNSFTNLQNNQFENKSTNESFNFNSGLGGFSLKDLGFGFSYLIK